jgi:hypothetical protein
MTHARRTDRPRHVRPRYLPLANALAIITCMVPFASRAEAENPGTNTEAPNTLSERETLEIAQKAYVYGYPLVTVEMTKRVMTNTAEPNESHAPVNQFALMRKYPDATFKDVTAPNADTLYAASFLDLTKEPMVFSMPDMGDRYSLFPMLSAWTEVFQVPGKRTTGTKAQHYLISGPGWHGQVPQGLTHYRAPTNTVWIIGRIYSTGTPEDYEQVHSLQDKLALVPLSSYGKEYLPMKGQIDSTIDMKKPVRDQVDDMDATTFFNTMAQAMATNPPVAADKPIVREMARIGVVAGKPVDHSKFAKVIAKWDGLMKIKGQLKKTGKEVNGWHVDTKTGNYGTNYLDRALIAAVGLGANRPEDAVYPTSQVDARGDKYDGGHDYVMHLAKNQLPPVRAFWSLTMYNDEFFFVENPLNRYTLSARNKFTSNPDGSIDLYVQKKDPGGAKTANWLPAPDGKFALMLRLYWPSEQPPSILNGSWRPPAVQRVN